MSTRISPLPSPFPWLPTILLPIALDCSFLALLSRSLSGCPSLGLVPWDQNRSRGSQFLQLHPVGFLWWASLLSGCIWAGPTWGIDCSVPLLNVILSVSCPFLLSYISFYIWTTSSKFFTSVYYRFLWFRRQLFNLSFLLQTKRQGGMMVRYKKFISFA